MDPNFPAQLNIAPLSEDQGLYSSTAFEFNAQAKAIERYGIAGRVWEAAVILLPYLHGSRASISFSPSFSLPVDPEHPITFLELGAGSGVVGLGLAEMLVGLGRTNDCVILTDLPQVCELLKQNLSLHAPVARIGIARVEPLTWGNAKHFEEINRLINGSRISYIICSDLVYFPDLFAPLLRSLLHLTSSENPPDIIFSYKIRSLTKETPFWAAFGLWFVFEPVLSRPNESQPWKRFGADSDSYVFCATRRLESLSWDIPIADAALLGGEGAGGTPVRKCDDAFETLLFAELGDIMS